MELDLSMFIDSDLFLLLFESLVLRLVYLYSHEKFVIYLAVFLIRNDVIIKL